MVCGFTFIFLLFSFYSTKRMVWCTELFRMFTEVVSKQNWVNINRFTFCLYSGRRSERCNVPRLVWTGRVLASETAVMGVRHGRSFFKATLIFFLSLLAMITEQLNRKLSCKKACQMITNSERWSLSFCPPRCDNVGALYSDDGMSTVNDAHSLV